MTTADKRKGIKGIVFIAMLAFAVLTSFGAEAAGSCTVKMNGGSVTPECPDGRKARYDISPKCIEDANKAAGACLNTMPVTNVARIPEDVCFRGTGWSRKRNHNGMDYAAGLGTAVTAAMDGVISRYSFGVAEPARGVCQSSGGGYGNVVYIEHKGCDGTYTTRYGHLTNKPISGLKEGSVVKKGQLIGYVGGTGGACGRPHLHFELRGPGDALVNPMCDQVQSICNCKTPVPSSGLSKCKDASFAASSSTPIDAAVGTTAVSIGSSASNSETPLKGSSSCAPYEEVRNSYREWGCIFCKPFEILFNTASVMAKQSFDALAKAVVVVVMVAFAIWLSFVTIRFVSTMEIREPRIYIKTLLNQAFRVLVVVILLNSGLSQILALSVDPVFSTGLKVAQLAGKISDTCTLGDDKLTIVGADKGGLSPSMGTGILCTIKAIQDQIGDILAMGELSWCLAWSSENAVMIVFPHLAYLITAIFYYIGGLLLLLIYPFLLVDCVLKLSIAVALLPAALGAFAFKVTANYLQKIWEIFLNAVFSFIFLSIIIYIIASIAADTLNQIIGDTDIGITIKFFWWMVEVIKVVAVCFLGWAVLGEMKSFADKFAGGLKMNDIGSPTGSFANEFFLKRPGMAVGKPIAKSAMKAGKAAGNVLSEGYHRASINAWRNMAQDSNKIGSPVSHNMFQPVRRVQNPNGDGTEMYDTTGLWQRIRGKKEYRTFTTDASGNTKMNVTIQDKKGRRTEVETDAYATVTRKYNRDGAKTEEQAKINAALLKYAMRKDGTYNQEVVNNFMQNTLLSEEDKQVMFVQAVMQERMGGNALAQMNDSFESRTIEKGSDEEGRETWTINQTYSDGSRSSFKVSFGANNRVLSEFKHTDSKGNGKSFATDGIVQRKSYISTKTNADGSKETVVENRYAFSKYYSQIANRPLYSNGDTADNIPAGEIMFGQKDMQNFAEQVGKKGNKKYTFKEFN